MNRDKTHKKTHRHLKFEKKNQVNRIPNNVATICSYFLIQSFSSEMILIYMKSENGHYQSTLLVFETVSQATVNALT